ncbi:MAG: hypothetical protein L3J23_04845 [Flavobacteriaceae bacterium]|nr:hypothetical protein [Flavobacteriaceae bacterium]
MKSKYYLLVLLGLSFLINFSSKYFIDFKELTYNFYSEQLAQEQLEKLIENQEKWSWLVYIVLLIIVLLRSSLVALCLSVGNFFYNIDEDEEQEPKFKQFFRIALLGEFVLLFVGVFKLLYFLFIQTDYTLLDLQQYYPLSFVNFLDLETLEAWLVYPLQTVNLFEIAYFFVLVYGLHKLLKNKYWRSFEMVAVSYGTGLAIWLGLVMFLTLNMS